MQLSSPVLYRTDMCVFCLPAYYAANFNAEKDQERIGDYILLIPGEGILQRPEGIDLMQASIELSGPEVSLVNAMNRESVFKQYLSADAA